ncbi:MAG TPA: hypothetical protein DD381_12115 [Lentisphaeria bacterium]|nr:MAG: hypothetical protein A2X47_09615 [Lentisphaerae bacterium GWF2_38_69]HBM17071.1 hypothetical protein [Lentisphaeria bacterium]
MDFNLILVLVIFLIVLLAAFIISLTMLIAYRKSYHDLKMDTGSISDKYMQVGEFMKFFAEKISSNLHDPNVYSELARKIAIIINAKDLCIYTLSNSNCFIPVGYTDTFPIIFSNKKFILSKPRFVIDALKQDKIDINEGIFGEIAAAKKGLLINNVSYSPQLSALDCSHSISSFMACPFIQDDAITGIICAVNEISSAEFSEKQFVLLESLTRVFSVVNQIMQSYYIASNKSQLDKEIEVTRLLQQSLLPKGAPQWSPFEIYACTRSSKEVSGDFYDFVEIDDDRLLVVLGDASGKGLPACMMMAMTRSFIRANSARFTTLNDMMLELNSNLYRETDEGRFATVICCLLNRKEKSVELARAGHTELIIFSSRQKIRKIKPNGAALGLLPPDMANLYDSLAFTFKPYYSMLLFSDGVTEVLNANREEFGSERLSDVFYESCCRKNSPSKTADRILRNIDEFCGHSERNDDQTIVIIAHEDSFI